MSERAAGLLDAWIAADVAARNAEDKVHQAVLARMHSLGPGPSDQLIQATVRLRRIATERFQKLASAGQGDIDHSAPGELSES